jgi:hypothetical protein
MDTEMPGALSGDTLTGLAEFGCSLAGWPVATRGALAVEMGWLAESGSCGEGPGAGDGGKGLNAGGTGGRLRTMG